MPHSGLWIPKHLQGGQKKISVVFYYQRSTGHISPGFPENFPLPKLLKNEGFEKIVCRTVHEVELWDKKCREQERREQEMTDEQREAVEGPIRAKARADLVSHMMNSRNALNREFCRQALLKLDEHEERMKMKRESFQHLVGYEDGH